MSLPPAIKSELPAAVQQSDNTSLSAEDSSSPSGKNALVARHTEDKAAQFVKNQSAAGASKPDAEGESTKTAGDLHREKQTDWLVGEIERYKMDNPVSGLSQQLLDGAENADNGLEKGVGYALAYGVGMPLEMLMGAGTMVANVPVNSAQVGVHLGAALHAATWEGAADQVIGALPHALEAGAGILGTAAVTSRLGTGMGARPTVAMKTAAASGEQALHAFANSDNEGQARLKETAIGAVSGAAGALVSEMSHNAVGGAAGQAVEDLLSGEELQMSTMMRAAMANAATGSVLDGIGSTTVSSNLARQVTLRP